MSYISNVKLFKSEVLNELLKTEDINNFDLDNKDHLLLFYFNHNKESIFSSFTYNRETLEGPINNNSTLYLKLTKKYSIIESSLNALKRSYDIHNKKKLFNSFIIISILIYGSSFLKEELNVLYNIEELNLFITNDYEKSVDDEIDLCYVDLPNNKKQRSSYEDQK